MRGAPDPKRELIVLLSLQLATLEKEVFGVLTDGEHREYWRRHDRIHMLHSQLSGLRALASEKIHVESVRGRKRAWKKERLHESCLGQPRVGN